MLLIIIVAILIAAMTYFQLAQGFYSALVAAVLTVVCMMLAFNFYEPLGAILSEPLGGAAEGLSLLALFALPLLALRLAVDKLMPANALTGVWLNRIGGGAMGLFTATTAMGVLTLGLQMLPVPATILGYAACNDSLQRQSHLIPFYPDDFVAGMVDLFSGGSMGNDRPFAHKHGDLVRELFAGRVQIEQTRKVDNADVKEFAGRTDATSKSFSVLGVYDATSATWAGDIQQEAAGEPGGKVIVVRVSIDPLARDTDNWYRLPASHFRLVTQGGASHYPLAFLTAWEDVRTNRTATSRASAPQWQPILPPKADTPPQIARLAVQRSADMKRLVVDWVFRLGADEKPAEIFFRRTAVQPLTEPKPGLPDEKDALGRIVIPKN